MKFLFAFLLCIPFAFATGCANHLPKPVNANGTPNASVAVGEAAIKFAESVDFAQGYIQTCHANMATVGCSEAKITQIKAAIVKGQTAVHAAAAAVQANPNAGGATLDGYIADLNIVIALLQTLVPPGGH
jgi:hypothetical protein